MTTKALSTMHYAREFMRRLSADKHTKYVIHVEDLSHMPRMSKVRSLTGDKAMGCPERIAGYYQGTEDLTSRDIAEAIDAVDDFVPKALRAVA